LPRKYHQEKRSATAEETRQRIVDATVALHAEKGIVATSVKDIAARADVGVGTVYHHFPTYDDVVRASDFAFRRSRIRLHQRYSLVLKLFISESNA